MLHIYNTDMIEVAYSSFCLFCGQQHKNKHFGDVGRAGRHPKAFGLTLKHVFVSQIGPLKPQISCFFLLSLHRSVIQLGQVMENNVINHVG